MLCGFITQIIRLPCRQVIMPLAMQNLNSCQLCFTCTNPLLQAFKALHEPDISCSSALLNTEITILTPVMSVALEQIVFLACCYFCRRCPHTHPWPSLFQLIIILPLSRRVRIFQMTSACISSSRFAMLLMWAFHLAEGREAEVESVQEWGTLYIQVLEVSTA